METYRTELTNRVIPSDAMVTEHPSVEKADETRNSLEVRKIKIVRKKIGFHSPTKNPASGSFSSISSESKKSSQSDTHDHNHSHNEAECSSSSSCDGDHVEKEMRKQEAIEYMKSLDMQSKALIQSENAKSLKNKHEIDQMKQILRKNVFARNLKELHKLTEIML